MKWNVTVDMTLTFDYEGIKADSREEARQIAENMAREDIGYNDAEEKRVSAIVWEGE